LTAVGVYAEDERGYFVNTALSDGLRSDRSASLRPLARTLQDPALWAAWGHLLHGTRTGDNVFEALHGTDVWSHRRMHPEHNAVFNDNMTALTAGVAAAVASSYDFSEISSVVDVGGGEGVLLAAVLEANPHLRGTVFDQAHVVPGTAPPGASDSVASRWETATGSFFEEVPAADAYLLKSILHDWTDERCVEILRACRRSLQSGGVVLVVELVLGRPGYEAEVAFNDLNMLVLPGGRERGEQEFAALFQQAGLQLTRVLHTQSRVSLLEARARGQGA
jgi:hypothetical protein